MHDHPGIVSHEVVGLLVTLWMVPEDRPWWVPGFALFRFFHIPKPWPIRRVDREAGGDVGIMLDDLLAGVAAWAVPQALAWGAGWVGDGVRGPIAE